LTRFGKVRVGQDKPALLKWI
jgi:hypothetical protein